MCAQRDDGNARCRRDAVARPDKRRDRTAQTPGASRAVPQRLQGPVADRAGAALERVRDRWQLSGASDHHVSEALYLTDPEDNGVEIYRDRPRAEWPRADDGTVRIGTVPLDLTDLASRSDGAAAVPPDTTVGHVHLEVSSIDAARAFYVDALGLRVQTAARGALFVAAGDYHHHLALNVWNGRSEPLGGRGLAWVELVVPDEATLGTVRRRLEDADVAAREWDCGLEIRDPDGIPIRLRAA